MDGFKAVSLAVICYHYLKVVNLYTPRLGMLWPSKGGGGVQAGQGWLG